ncbi:uncharacterized protein At4g15970 [Amborella trichopoda]|uniref:uncharacterized protein At4g15970 n=1 Tax=Amborella trichopoda TaxID=13333 RepID=UPI0009BE551D|nr:uncharacterized protein At4g15970 [Amborella trichopoda]|eukprot:XP_011627574.2 uncharacterized protein At4g15970 [Amborella trichopoda]
MKRALSRSNYRAHSHFTMKNPGEIVPDSHTFRRYVAHLLFILAIVFPCVILFRIVHPLDALPRLAGNSSENFEGSLENQRIAVIQESDDSTALWETEDNKLDAVLKKAAMVNKTVILTTLNEAWAAPNSVIDLFLESFRWGERIRQLLDHLVIVCLDQKAFARCSSIHNHCYALSTEGVDFSGEKYFMTPDYLKMMWRRIDFLRTVLEMGYNFIFTDADIMWFRNPFPYFYQDTDFQIACDHFLGNPSDLANRPNGGFNYVVSNNRTIEFYKFWYSSRQRYPGFHDQDVLNVIKYDPAIEVIGLKIRFLSTAYFGGFCEPSKDLNVVCTMHANCCYGLGNKLHDLRIILEDWRKFMALPIEEKRLRQLSWRAPQNCSISSARH